MKHKGLVLFLLAFAQFLVVLDTAITNVALPAIKEALDFNDSQLTWVVTAYVLTFGGFLMLGGRAADLFGRRRILLIGMVGFALSSLAIGLSQTDTMMITARAIQGVTAALMSPAALSTLLTVFREGPERTKALAVWATVASGGAAVGVFLGGALTQYIGWEWNFFINVPLALGVAFGIYKTIPAHIKEEKDKSLDLPGAVLVTSGLMALVYAVSHAGEAGWDLMTGGILAAGILLLAGFVYNESRVKHPLMPLSIFKIRSLTGGNLVMMTVGASITTMFFFASLYMQDILQYEPLVTGVSFLAMPVVIGAVSMAIAPKMIQKFGFKRMLMTGLTFFAVGMFLLSLAPLNGIYVLHIMPALLLMGIGGGFTFVSASIAATSGVPAHESGLASGILSTSQQAGGAIGLSVMSSIAAAVTASSLAGGQPDSQALLSGYQATFVTASILLSAGLLVAIFVINTKPGKPNQAD